MAEVGHQLVRLMCPVPTHAWEENSILTCSKSLSWCRFQRCYVWKLPRSTQENWNGKKTSLKWHDYTWPHRPSMVLIWKRFQVLCIIHIRFVMIFFDKSRCFQQNQNQHWPSWWSKAMGTADSIRAPWLERKPSWKIIPTGSTSSIFLERYWRSRGHWQTLNSKKHNHPQMTQHARKHRPC